MSEERIRTNEDRGEIRWKFQVMLENLDMVRKNLENERKFIDERQRRAVLDIERMRNYWLAGIGFFIAIFTSIFLARNLDYIYLVYPSIAGAAGFAIWFLINIKLNNAYIKFREIDDTYYVINNGLLTPLKGMVSTFALIEDFKKEDFTMLFTYVTLYTKSITYKFIQYIDESFNVKQFKHEDYRNHYLLAKSSIEKLKEKNYELGTGIIDEFINKFKKRDKRKKKSNK